MVPTKGMSIGVRSSPIQGSVLLRDVNVFLRDVLGFNLFYRISAIKPLESYEKGYEKGRIKRTYRTEIRTPLKLILFDTKRYKTVLFEVAIQRYLSLAASNCI